MVNLMNSSCSRFCFRRTGPTVVTLCPGPSPVPPPPLRRVGVPLNHRRNEAGVADWKWRENSGVSGHSADRLLFNGSRTH